MYARKLFVSHQKALAAYNRRCMRFFVFVIFAVLACFGLWYNVAFQRTMMSKASHLRSLLQSEISVSIDESPRIDPHDKRVVITGMIKDGEPDLLGFLLQVEQFACQFEDYDIVIMENGSEDDTPYVLRIWQRRPVHCDAKHKFEVGKAINPRKHLLQYASGHDPAPDGLSREDRFAHYRNIQLNFVINHLLQYHNKHIDYLVMVDFDVQAMDQSRVIQEWLDAQQQYPSLTGFCVNGMIYTGKYRDTFATVFDDGWWCHEHDDICHERVQQTRFTPVQSCFGGLAIYDFQQLYNSQCRYHTMEEIKQQQASQSTYKWMKQRDTEAICEHVAYHDCLRERVEDFNLVLSRDSYVYYGFDHYGGWEQERVVHTVLRTEAYTHP